MSKIRYIKRRDLDVKPYDDCIDKSYNPQIYALSWYLDSVADFWDVLVYEDYEAVMPIPFLKLRRNLFLPKIYVPPFVQQLGIFYKTSVNQEIEKMFLEEFTKLSPEEYAFNSKNQILNYSRLNLHVRPNFELNLEAQKQILFQNYTQNLQRNIRKAQKSNLEIGLETNIEKLIDFQVQESNYSLKKTAYNKLELLYKELDKRELVQIYEVLFERKTVAMVLVIFYKYRIINLLPVSNKKGRQLNAMAFLLDDLIQKHSDKPIVLDFEGSSIESIARFYKSFGATKIEYPFYQKPRLFF